MRRQVLVLAIPLALMSVALCAQTNVTNGNNGTTNIVPVYTGSATLGNSPLSINGGKVGIGTTPQFPLDVAGQANFIAGTFPPVHATRSVSTGSGLYGAALFELTSSTPIAGNGSGFYVKAPNSLGASTFAGLVGAGLTTITAGSEIGYIGFKAAFNGGDPGNGSYGMRLVAVSSASDNALFSGSVGIGTSTPGSRLEINGDVTLTSGSGASLTFADGTKQATAWTGVLCGGDYAEAVETKGQRNHYEPGNVLVISNESDSDVEKSSAPYSTSVAGIYATKPGVVGKRESLKKVSDDIPMAMVGIVPTKVSTENGPIGRGDLLVTSSIPGYAMRGTDQSRMLGAVIGKAMGALNSGTGTIEVLVTLQ